MIYLDHAATSLPKPREVADAMLLALETAGNPARGGHRLAIAAERLVEGARRSVADLLGADAPRRVIFTLNGTDALNIAIHAAVDHATPRGPLPHVVTTVLEHNSVTRPLCELRDSGRIDLDIVDAPPSGILDADRIGAAMRPSTLLVAATMASNALGTLQPMARIAEAVRARGDALLLVDASQALGAVPMDVRTLGADLVAAPGHKALLGPMGTGVLWVGPRAMPAIDGAGSRLGVFRSGGTGGDSRLPHMPPELPHRLEGGTPNVVGIAGLGAGARWVLERGVATIRDHERTLVSRALKGLAHSPRVRVIGPMEAEARVGAISFVIEGMDPLEVGAMLDASFDIAMRPGLHCAPGAHRAAGTFPAGTVRMSVGPTTTDEEIDRALEAVREIAASA